MSTNIVDIIVRGMAAVVTLYVILLTFKFVRWVFRSVTRISAEGVARAAGKASKVVEHKAGRVAQAFKDGRRDD